MAAHARPAGEPGAELDDLTVERARRGERAAQRALVERYQRRVLALLHRLRGSAGGVEDLAQETFLRVFRDLPSFRPTGPARLSTWILTIATRLAIDARRRDAVRAARVPEPSPPVPSPERALEARALSDAVQAAIEDLSDPFRAALVLRVYHDLGYAEIADALGCDVGTAKSRVSRAREQLRAALEEVRR
ncbi:MAG: RNA polymerase sigma factor [Sandaracinaceae bacterium]